MPPWMWVRVLWRGRNGSIVEVVMLNLLRRGKDGEQRRLEVDTPFTVGYAVFDCAKEEAVESHIRCRDGDKPAKKAIQKAKKTDTRPPKRTAQSIAKGIIGTVKAEAGIDRRRMRWLPSVTTLACHANPTTYLGSAKVAVDVVVGSLKRFVSKVKNVL